MRLFGIAEATHYCSSFSASGGTSTGSINALYGMIKQQRWFVEGTAQFTNYRDCSLRDVERSMFLGASHYRRCLDLMTTASSAWALVTIYYGIWYLSRALLGMFGTSVLRQGVVEVYQGSPGNQKLKYSLFGKKPGQNQSTYRGSHKVYWDLFYQSIATLHPMVEPRLAPALAPVKGDPVWLIDARNNVNYDTHAGISLSYDFNSSFSETQFPSCLPGALGTEYRVLELMLEIVFSFAQQFGLRTDAIDNIGPAGALSDKIRSLVYDTNPPAIVAYTNRNLVT